MILQCFAFYDLIFADTPVPAIQHGLVLVPARSAGEIDEALVTQLEVSIQAICKDVFPKSCPKILFCSKAVRRVH